MLRICSETRAIVAERRRTDHLKAGLALEALQMALDSRQVTPGGPIHHSDRGVQYACGDYIAPPHPAQHG